MAGWLSTAPICWLGGECGTALRLCRFLRLRPLLFFCTAMWELNARDIKAGGLLRWGLFLWEAKHRWHCVRNAVPSFISHPPAAWLSVTPGLTWSLFDKGSVMAQAFKVVFARSLALSPAISKWQFTNAGANVDVIYCHHCCCSLESRTSILHQIQPEASTKYGKLQLKRLKSAKVRSD